MHVFFKDKVQRLLHMAGCCKSSCGTFVCTGVVTRYNFPSDISLRYAFNTQLTYMHIQTFSNKIMNNAYLQINGLIFWRDLTLRKTWNSFSYKKRLIFAKIELRILLPLQPNSYKWNKHRLALMMKNYIHTYKTKHSFGLICTTFSIKSFFKCWPRHFLDADLVIFSCFFS